LKDSGSTTGRWKERFVADAEIVSDEDLRDLYARILAGEMARQGTFSLRALSVIRDLEKEDAQLFKRFAPLVCAGDQLPAMEGEWAGFYRARGLQFDDILCLRDAGLVSHGDTFSWQVENSSAESTEVRILTMHGTLEFRQPKRSTFGSPWAPRIIRLTDVGKQLLTVLSIGHDREALITIARWIHGVVERRGEPPYTTLVTLRTANGIESMNEELGVEVG
jgi:hypothetical protein